jgi:rRNA maturation protein Nop10
LKEQEARRKLKLKAYFKMSLEILRCKQCGSFSLSTSCSCGQVCTNPLPPKFSPEDNYAKYRREAKLLERKKVDLI